MTDIKFTREAYDEFAEEYHKKRITNKRNFWNRFMVKPFQSLLVGELKNKVVLDLGCGSGITTRDLLKSKPKKVIGLDLSKNLIAIAKRENPKLDFYVGDAKKTPFNKSQFDVVASSLMVHYFKDLRPLFGEVLRILKKQGVFVFSMHHPLHEVMKKTKDKKNYKILPYFHNKKYTWGMKEGSKFISYHHTFENVINALNDKGFVIEKLIEPTTKTKDKKLSKKLKYPLFLIIKARKRLK